MGELSLVLWEWMTALDEISTPIEGRVWAWNDGSGVKEVIESAMRENYGLVPDEYEWSMRRLSLPGDARLN